MTKRVSISYTVDLSEVPQRVQMLLEELATSLNSIAEVSRTAGKKALKSASDEELDGLREIYRLKVLLEKVQERADDCFNILKGFVVMDNESATPPPTEQTPPVESSEKKPAAKKKTTKKKKKKKVKKDE